MGEYFVTTESSNVLYSNSILGARGYGGGGNLQNILHGSQPEQVFNQFKQAADLLHHHH